MKAMEKILVGLELQDDGNELSTGSLEALDDARWLAGETGAEIILSHATAGDRYLEPVGGVCVVVHEGLSEQGRASIEVARKGLEDAGVRARVLVEQGKAWMTLTKTALRELPGMVFIGRHNVREDGPRLGSVATKLIRKCPAPLWVVKPGRPTPPRRILAATDLSPVGQEVIGKAAYVAARTGAELHVIHAYQIPFGDQWARAREAREVPDTLRDEKEAAVQAQVDEAAADTPAHLHVGCNSPERGILAALEHLDPDLVVMGTVSRGGIPGLLMGETAERVLPRTTCSLLVVKPEGFVSPITLD